MFKLTSSYVSSYTLPSFHHITEGAGEPGDELSEHYFHIWQLSSLSFQWLKIERKSWKSRLSPSSEPQSPIVIFTFFCFISSTNWKIWLFSRMSNLRKPRRWQRGCLQRGKVRPPPPPSLCSLSRWSPACGAELQHSSQSPHFLFLCLANLMKMKRSLNYNLPITENCILTFLVGEFL